MQDTSTTETFEQENPVVVLFADICGSSPMYVRAGNTQALERIGAHLDRMASTVRSSGGTVVRSKGDDVLCTFAATDAAVRAAGKLVTGSLIHDMKVRIGAHRGEVIRARGDIFGDAVNLAARLLEIARPGEIVVTDAVAEDLSDNQRAELKFFGSQLLKGQSSPTDLYSVLLTPVDSLETQTVIVPRSARRSTGQASIRIEYQGREWTCVDGMKLSIGRSRDCDVVVTAPSVSREHATIEVRDGKATLNDSSTYGTWIAAETGSVHLRRESTFLVGRGEILLGERDAESSEASIKYEQHRAPEEASSTDTGSGAPTSTSG